MKASVDCANEHGNTPLLYAAFWNFIGICEVYTQPQSNSEGGEREKEGEGEREREKEGEEKKEREPERKRERERERGRGREGEREMERGRGRGTEGEGEGERLLNISHGFCTVHSILLYCISAGSGKAWSSGGHG